jgi:hypothetical protein
MASYDVASIIIIRRAIGTGAVSVKAVQCAKDSAMKHFDEAMTEAQEFEEDGFALFEDRAMAGRCRWTLSNPR